MNRNLRTGLLLAVSFFLTPALFANSAGLSHTLKEAPATNDHEAEISRLSSLMPPTGFVDPTTGTTTNSYFLDTLCQGQSIDHCIHPVVDGTNHDIESFSGNIGTVTIAPPSNPYDTCFRYVAPFNFTGYDNVSLLVSNSLGQTEILTITFLIVNPNTPVNAGPDQQLCNSQSSTTLSAVSPDPYAVGFWTKIGGTGTIVTPNSPTTSVTGMSLGSNIFVWHQNYPCDANTDVLIVFVYTGTPPIANAGPDVYLCSGTTYTMQANSPGVSATGTWEITAGNATIFNINSATALVANIGLGVNVFEWNISNGPCAGGDTDDQMIIYVYNANHPAANAGADQNYCNNALPNVTLTGSTPQVPATGTWTQVSGPNSATITTPNTPSTTLGNLAVGTYVFQWTINNGPCGTLVDQMVLKIYSSAQAAANAGPDQGLCLPNNFTTLAGNSFISPAIGTWSVISGTGSFANTNSPTTAVTNLANGANILRWTINNGPCGTTQDDVIITVYPAAQPPANAGADQQFCFTGTPIVANLSGSSFSAPATGTWSVISGTGTFGNASNQNTTVSGLSIGVNTIQWTVTNGPCGGGGSDTMVITVYNNSVAAANAGPDVSLCTPTAVYTMQATAIISPASGLWTQVSGPPGASIQNNTSPTTQITNLSVGTYVFQWTVQNGACGSGTNFDTMTILVFSNTAQAANAGPDQEFCFGGTLPITATMAANAATSPATGTWSFISGSGTITSPNSPSSTITGLFPGNYILQWTISNGPCGSSSDQVLLSVYNPNQTAANAGPDQQICSTTSSVALVANPLLNPATGQWSVVSGTGSFSNATNPNTTVTGLSLGINVFQWTIDNGPCANPVTLTDQVSVTVFNSAQAAANAGPDQSICNTTVSVNLAANTAVFPATGQWIVVSGSGVFANASSPVTSVTSMGVGQNIYQWSINNGPCGSITTDVMNLFVYSSTAPAANAGPDQDLCLPGTSTTLAGNAAIFPSTGTWIVISGTASIANPNSPTSAVSGLLVGQTVLQWTINNGPCGSITSDQVSITLFNNTQGAANAGPNANLCTPQSTYTMQATAVIFPAIGQWTLISGSGTIGDASNPTTLISGLGVGINVFRWTILNGPCPGTSNFDDMIINVFDQNQPVANAGPDQQFCFNGVNPVNATMAGSAVISPGSGTWTLIQGGGTIQSSGSPTTSITGLPVGQNIFQWSVSNGPCSPPATSDQVSIFVYSGQQAAANAGPDQAICSTNPATTLAGNAVTFPATGQWTIVTGTATFVNATSPTTAVSGLSIGANVLQWTISNGPCGSPTTDQVTITVYNQFQFPASAGSDFDICSTQSSITLTGNAVSSPATSLWSVVSGSGIIGTPALNSTTVTGLSVGTNIFQYTIFNGACNSQTSDQVVVTVYNGNQSAANAGPDQSFCLPQTSTTLSGNAVSAPGTGLWTLVSGTGVIANPANGVTTVSGLSVGLNVFQWSISNGPCTPGLTSDQVSITVYNNNQASANAGPDQSFCEPVSSAFLAANAAPFPATGQWFLIQGSGTIVNSTSPSTQVTNLTVGQNIFQWVINNGPCNPTQTTDQVSIFIYDDNQLPANAGADQSFCTPTSSTTLQGSAVIFPATGQWQLVSGSGIIVSPNSSTTLVLGMGVGQNIFSWSISNGPCSNSSTTDQVSIFVFSSSAQAANAGTDQQICTPQNSVTMSANAAVFPAAGTWQLVSGSGSIANIHAPGTVITGLSVGQNIFSWTIDNGGCGTGLTTDQVSIFVYDQFAPNADAGPDQDLCTPETSTFLDGSTPVFPGYGQWTLVSGTGSITDSSSPSTAVSGLAVGPNVFQWTVYNGVCGNAVTSDLVTITVFDAGFAQPDAGPDQELCSPTSSTTLQAVPAQFPGIGTWTLLQGTGTFSNINDPNAVISGLNIGVNILRWTVNYSTCGQPLDEVSIIVYNSAQGEAVAGVDQSFCTPVSSTNLDADAVLTPGYGTWSVIQGSASIQNPNDPNTLIAALPVGENIFVWTVYNGNCLAPELTTDTVSIFIYDANQSPANAGANQSFCTPTSQTTLTGNPPIFPASGQWVLLAGSGIISNPNSPVTNITGLAVGENIFQWSITNGPCNGSATSDVVSVFIFDQFQQAANAGPDQELCLPLTSTTLQGNAITFPATGTWQLISGTGSMVDSNNPNTSVTGLSVGANVFSWTVNNGPCGQPTADLVTIFVFSNVNPNAAAGPDQEWCTPQSNAVLSGSNLIFPATGMWTQIAGVSAVIVSPSTASTQVTGLQVGENSFVWTVYNGSCANTLTSDTMGVFIFDSGANVAFAGDDQSWCEPVNATTLEALVPDAPGVGTWSILQGDPSVVVADVNNPESAVTGLAVGETILQWTVYNGPCVNTQTTDLVSLFIYESTQPASDAGQDQEICTPQTSTALEGNDVVFPATGIWTLISGSGTIVNPADPQTQVTNLGFGDNVFQWTITNGPCDPPVTVDQVTIALFNNQQADAAAGPDQEFCLPTTSTTLTGSAFSGSSTGLWTLIQGTGTIANPGNSVTTVDGLTQGENVFVWSVSNGPCGTTTDTISVFIYNNGASEADAGPDVSYCTPVSTYQMLANMPDTPGVGTWQLILGTGTIADVNDPLTDISGLTIGANTFVWTIYNGPCEPVTTDTIVIYIYDENLQDADAGIDQELCLPQTATTMGANTPVFPATGTWTLISGSAVISDIHNAQTNISAIAVGENVFVWTTENGPCDDPITSDTVSVFLFNNNAIVANAGPDQEFCEPTSQATMNASVPDDPGVGTWTLVGGSGTILSPNDPASGITGLALGQNCFQWSVYNGPCSNSNTSDLIYIYIFDDDQPAADAGPDQELCTPSTSTNLQANVVIYPATGTWTLIGGGATIANVNDPNTAVSNLAPGVNTFVWTISNGPCVPPLTTDTVQISIYLSSLPVASAGADQEWCLPVTIAVVDGSNLGGAATGLWTLIDGGGTIVDPTTDATQISDLPVGENIFQWAVDNGPCGNSADQLSIFIFDPNAAVADAGPDAYYCTPTDTHTMQGNTPDDPGVGTWSLLAGGGVVQEPNNPQSEITNLPIGENIFLWCIYNGPCALPTCDVVSIFIYNENTPPSDAGPDQELCLPNNCASMDASPAEFPAIGEWSVVAGTGIIADVNDPQSELCGLTLGVNSFVWTVNNGPCTPSISSDTVTVLVFEENIPAYAGPDQEICTPQSVVTMNANFPEVPNYGTWQLVSGSGFIVDPSNPQTEISGLAVGINCFSWSVYNGPCANSLPTDIVCIYVFDQNQPPADAGPDQEFCLPQNTTTLAGNTPTIPATGTWQIVCGSGTINSPGDPNTTVSNLTEGINCFVWTIDNGPCANALTSDTMVVEVFPSNPQIADAGPNIELCSPDDCPTLQGVAPTEPSVGTWSVVSAVDGTGPIPFGTIDNVNNPNAIICALGVGLHTLQWELYNGPCNVPTTDLMTIAVYDSSGADAGAGPDQELCWPTSTTTLAGNTPLFPSSGTWSVISGAGTVTNASDPSSTITGLEVGITVLEWSVYEGPCGTTTDTVTITVFDPNSPEADAGPDQEICEDFPEVIMDGSEPLDPSFGYWTLISGSGDILDSSNAHTTVSDVGYLETMLVWQVYNGACGGWSYDTVSVFVNSPTVGAAFAGDDQSFCGVVDLLQLNASDVGLSGAGNWTTVAGGGTFSTTTDDEPNVTDIPVGTNSYVWTVDNGVCGFSSDTINIFVFDPDMQLANAGPSVAICEHLFSPFNMVASEVIPPATGYWNILEGPAELFDPSDPNTEVTDIGEIATPLVDVISILEWTVSNGPCGSSADTLMIVLEDCLTVEIPDAFSPNGDGVNDTWEIPNIETYPQNRVEIFNRWGALIYESAPYHNEWDGRSSHPATIGEELPSSTYYYVLDLGTGEEAFHGFVYLKR